MVASSWRVRGVAQSMLRRVLQSSTVIEGSCVGSKKLGYGALKAGSARDRGVSLGLVFSDCTLSCFYACTSVQSVKTSLSTPFHPFKFDTLAYPSSQYHTRS